MDEENENEAMKTKLQSKRLNSVEYGTTQPWRSFPTVKKNLSNALFMRSCAQRGMSWRKPRLLRSPRYAGCYKSKGLKRLASDQGWEKGIYMQKINPPFYSFVLYTFKFNL